MNPNPSPFTTEWNVVLAISLASCLMSFGPSGVRALALPFLACSVVLLIVLVAHETSANQSVNPKETVRRKPPIEWSILRNARPAPGTAVGTYAGNEFPTLVIDEFGRPFEYVGVAPRRIGGQCAIDALKPEEFIVQLGLLYIATNEREVGKQSPFQPCATHSENPR